MCEENNVICKDVYIYRYMNGDIWADENIHVFKVPLF